MATKNLCCRRQAHDLRAVASIIIWAVLGPVFGYSDTWQLVINTATTIMTFLIVFLIQNTQNHDTQALQLKLDELIRASKGAHNLMLPWIKSRQPAQTPAGAKETKTKAAK